ncbi:MAG: sulfotransferase [Bacteroidetes bacterium CG23_combo_of_CG06-09_8_20_14_all_32_9]|nr:MAG: sulfotransferase [Bacteroidetes bacterium CG23_combo_of_CG06-09_8_20_14_all_32_9]
MKKNIVWLASYPKSGNTWCRVFLANYLSKSDEPVNINHLNIGAIFSSRQIIEDNTGFDISELTADECDELRSFAFEKWAENYDENAFVKTHDAFVTLPSGENMFPVRKTKAAVYFIRNPLDVAVSFANHLGTDPEKAAEKMCENKFCLAASKKKYNQQIRQRLLSWSGHVQSWTTQNNFPVLVVRYENILENSEREFQSILQFLNIPYNSENFIKALKYSNFENMKKAEQETGFKEKSPACKTFFKVGKSGYYKNILSENLIQKIINEHFACMKKYHYLSNSGELII